MTATPTYNTDALTGTMQGGFAQGHYDPNPIDKDLNLPDPGASVMHPDINTGPSAAGQIGSGQQQLSILSGLNYGTLMPEQQQVYGQQGQLVNQLLATAGGTGPSVANTQLQQGLGQINRNTMSQAAGATGAGGVLARYGAMQAGGEAAAQANQAAAIQRAQEIAQARQQAASIMAQQQQTTSGLYGTNLQGVSSIGGQDLNAETDLEKTNQATNQKMLSGAGGALLSAL